MRVSLRPPSNVLRDRVVWQCASLLLCYPDDVGISCAAELLEGIGGAAADRLRRTVDALRAAGSLRAATEYVDTFDMNRRATLYLTYWTAGDTRNRGTAMLEFSSAYRAAGMRPPCGEAPDFLPVVLEFAATVDAAAGRRLLAAHRVSIDVLHAALTELRSPYADTVAAVRTTLPAPTDRDAAKATRLVEAGPPAESVGLQPFTLTVPPRRT
ncbi:MAG TPA: nitrate reductase molybdenum cofactor assembly chaperone [Mycobacterium sp.]|nr:nitrate reductase molybdenum cofactor assembly chaperone [Mycobacterium sp.]